jgi:hypothetical protein
LWFIAAVLSTNPEAKHFPSISLISIAVIVIPIAESRSWRQTAREIVDPKLTMNHKKFPPLKDRAHGYAGQQSERPKF